MSDQTETGDVSTQLSHERTNLSLERSCLASERTLMSWIRTSLSMITFGFTIGKLGQVLQEFTFTGVMGRARTVSLRQLALFLVILGTTALFAAAVQYRIRVHELCKKGSLRRQISITFPVALLLAIMGLFALTSLVLAL